MTRARDVANLIGSGNYSSTTFTATAGQTVFSIAHTQNFVQVFMNGLLLDLTVDYTSNGSAVTLTSGAAAGDEIEVVAYNTFSVGDALNQAAADTRYVNATGDTMSGDLTIDTDTFHVDVADNRVGIGTTAPLRQLHISNTSANSEIAFTAGTSGVSSILFGDGLTGADVYKGYLQYNHAQDKMLIATAAGSSINIDSAGRVTMPYQPSFLAYGAGSWTTLSSGATAEMSLANETYDVGNNYANSRFTAPVAGKYLLNLHAYVRIDIQGDSGSHGYTYIRKNGSNYGVTNSIFGYFNNGDADQMSHVTVIMDMAANDYASGYFTAASGACSYYGGASQFSGILIG